MSNYPRKPKDVSVGKPWGKGRLTHDFSGPLASRKSSKPIDSRNRFDVFEKKKSKRGFRRERSFRTNSKK